MPDSSNKHENRNTERKRDHLAFFICILLATGFWFFIKLSDNYSVSYQMKVKFTHVPMGKLVTAIKDSSLTVRFKSNGYNLLDLMLHRKLDSLDVNLLRNNIRKEARNNYVINTSNLRESVAQSLDVNDREIEFGKPELRFTMEHLHKKRIKLSARLDLSFKSQFRLYGSKLIPDYITVYGPRQILDTLKTLKTSIVRLEKLESNQKIQVNIQNPYPEILRLNPSKVIVRLDVERYTERKIQIPVSVSDIHPEIRTFPTTVSVSFNVFIRDYEKIHAKQFKIIPNIKNINLRNVKTLRLEVVSSPKDVSNVRINPPDVEFIIIN